MKVLIAEPFILFLAFGALLGAALKRIGVTE